MLGELFAEVAEVRNNTRCINKRMDVQEEKMDLIEAHIKKQSEGMEEVRKEVERWRRQAVEMERRMDEQEDMIAACGRPGKELEGLVKELEWKVIDQEARSRRNNLLIDGVPEDDVRPPEAILQSIMQQVGTPNLRVERVHRIGPPRGRNAGGQATTRPRPIIAKFLSFKDKELFRSQRRKLPRGTYVRDDFPEKIRAARNTLKQRQREMWESGKRAHIVYPAKLVCEGKLIESADVLSA